MTYKRKTSVEKLAARITAAGHPIDPATFHRTYAGKWQRLGWCWSWVMMKGTACYGSPFTVKELLAKPELTIRHPPGEVLDWEVT